MNITPFVMSMQVKFLPACLSKKGSCLNSEIIAKIELRGKIIYKGVITYF